MKNKVKKLRFYFIQNFYLIILNNKYNKEIKMYNLLENHHYHYLKIKHSPLLNHHLQNLSSLHSWIPLMLMKLLYYYFFTSFYFSHHLLFLILLYIYYFPVKTLIKEVRKSTVLRSFIISFFLSPFTNFD